MIRIISPHGGIVILTGETDYIAFGIKHLLQLIHIYSREINYNILPVSLDPSVANIMQFQHILNGIFGKL